MGKSNYEWREYKICQWYKSNYLEYRGLQLVTVLEADNDNGPTTMILKTLSHRFPRPPTPITPVSVRSHLPRVFTNYLI